MLSSVSGGVPRRFPRTTLALFCAATGGAVSFRSTNTTMTEVITKHSFTGRMCAATRGEESERTRSLFTDPLGRFLAGSSGVKHPMGDWILVPRTRFGDDFLVRMYTESNCRQLVMLGAGMDARAYRRFAPTPDSSPTSLIALPELSVFEIDQPTTFDVKEPLLESLREKGLAELTVKARYPIGVDFNDKKKSWVEELSRSGFDPAVPTVWLLEGLIYYLPDTTADPVVTQLFKDVGTLSAPGSGVFHDSITQSYSLQGIAPGGAPFISGSDDYAGKWHDDAGFDTAFVRNFDSISVDRGRRRLQLGAGSRAEAAPPACKGRNIVLFVTAEKGPARSSS